MKNKINWLLSHWYIPLGILLILVLVFYPKGPETIEQQVQRQKQEELKFGYTEAELRGVYKEVISAEDGARAESEDECPTNASDPDFNINNMQKCLDNMSILSEEARLEVLQQRNLTEDNWSEVKFKAFKENWPLD